MNKRSEQTESTPDRWQSIKEIVADALALKDSERPDFVDRACQGQPTMKREVLSLLRAAGESPDFLQSPVLGKHSPEWDAVDEGDVLGPYCVLHVLGEGGFGIVYAAEQSAPIQRRVALKILKPGMDTRQILARFNAERQVLARLNHPHIAKVLDAGETPRGRPYFVMEYVEGESITHLCDRHLLSIPERLDLFLQVCSAIQHAHQKGIVHRDIKPSNVLVEDKDGTLRALVIDFGIAKAIEETPTKSLLTQNGVLLGTPDYMSPEQAGLNAFDIDTRTDVYSLGVLLFELLAGVRPFDASSNTNESQDEIRRRIREVEPKRPSSRILVHEDSLPEATSFPNTKEIARLRKTTPSILRKRLRGDLDWIILKALEKDRDRRYDSASHLAMDIERHLRNEPVKAGPPSYVYRFHKFALRNRVLLGMIAVAAIALITGTSLAVVGFLEARSERDAARAAETREREAREGTEDALKEAELVADFLTRMLRSARATEEGRDVRVYTIVEQASRDIETLEGRPLLLARLHDVLGNTFEALGALDQAEHHLEIFRRITEAELGLDHRDTIRSSMEWVQLRFLQSRQDEVEQEYREVVERAERILPPGDPLTVRAKDLLARYHFEAADYKKAADLYQVSLAEHEKAFGARHPDTHTTAMNLAQALMRIGEAERAEQILEERVRWCREEFGDDDPETMIMVSALATALLSQGRAIEAIPILKDLVERKTRVYGEDHLRTMGTVSYLALAHQSAGQGNEAEQLYNQTLVLHERKLGPLHRQTIMCIHNLGMLMLDQGRLEEAQSNVSTAYQRAQQSSGHENVQTASMAYHLALIESRRNNFDAAYPLYNEAVRALSNTGGRDHPKAEESRDGITKDSRSAADVLMKDGAFEKAAEILVGAWEVLDELDAHALQRMIAQKLVEVYERSGNEGEAEFWREEADTGRRPS